MRLDVASLELASRMGWAVIHSLWQGALVAALLALALALLRHRTAAARHTVCLLALAAMLAGFGVTLTRSGTELARAASQTAAPAVPPRILERDREMNGALRDAGVQWDLSSSDPRGAEASAARPVPPPVGDTAPPTAAKLVERLAGYAPRVGAVWIVGIALLSLWRIGGCWRVRSLRRIGVRAASAEAQRLLERLAEALRVRRAVRLLETSRASVPMLTGFLRPVILLPARLASGLSSRELEGLLAHELAHVARGDAWTNLLVLCAETIFFYQPAAWWIARRARTEREHAADDLALGVCEGRGAYATALARLAELGSPPDLALAASGGHLVERIRRVLGKPAGADSAAGVWAGGAALLSAALIFSQVLAVKAADEEKAIAVAPGQSIQQAIDRAAAGAVIRLGEGEWKERIVITKPLTLEGAGWEKTRITIEEPATDEIKAAASEIELRLKAATTAEEKRQVASDSVERVTRPAIFVRGTGGVSLRKLRVQGVSQRGREDGGTASTLVHFRRAKATMTECAVVGPFGNGIHIADESDVEIRGTLIAAIWHNGIVVYGRGGRGGDDAPSRLQLIESEVRNVYHYGVAIGAGCDTTVVERSRLSGTAWHGIRYDEASPTITRNAIFQNARSGIYASGKTAATVRGNLFWKNEMGGMSCWFDNADTIEGNTFVGNLREGVAVIGAKPVVTRNIFSGNPIAIACSKTEMRGGGLTPLGVPVLTANLFHETPAAVQAGEEKKPAPEGSLTADPKFRDPAKLDFAAVADSPAGPANIGVAEPLAPSGPWPLLAEEKAIIPAGETREYRFWTAPGEAKPSKSAEDLALKAAAEARELIADASQLDTPPKRRAFHKRVSALLESADAGEIRAGLSAFLTLQNAQSFDKFSFAAALRKLLASTEADIRSQALLALAATGPNEEDLERAIALLNDPAGEVRTALPAALKRLSPDGFTGTAGDAILKLLDRNDGKATQSVWRAMDGTRISPEIERRVVEASRKDAGVSGGSEAFQWALTRHQSKREPTVTRLIELATSLDAVNVGGHALWGIRQGLADDQRPRVAEFALNLLRSERKELHRDALQCLQQCGTSANAPALKALLTEPGVTDEMRSPLEQTLVAIESRPAPQAPVAPSAENSPPQPNEPNTMKTKSNILISAAAATTLATLAPNAELNAADAAALREKVMVLEQRLAQLEGNAATDQKARAGADGVAKLVEKNRQAARTRAAEDRKTYTPAQLQEIETLYQVANTKGKRSPEAKESLKQLLEKYDKANRTGCALLYLGQASEGAERVEYLTRAVEKFSDCYYFNGCQVGGYGRYVLALTLWESGEKDKARSLIAELKTTYKEATDHRQRPITELADAAEKQLEAQK